MFNLRLLKIILIIFSLLFIFALSVNELDAKSKQSKKKKKYRPRIVNIQIKQEKIIEESIINEDLIYRNINLGDGKRWFNVHFAKINTSSLANRIFVGKSKNYISGLSNFVDFIAERPDLSTIQVMINANFWSAYRNYPIGPTIINGELVSFRRYKQWSSLLFDTNNIPFIDNFDITGKLIISPQLQFEIGSVNRRKDSTSLCFYNHYAGDSIPYIHTTNIAKALDSAYLIWMQEKAIYLSEDDTEQEFDTLAFIEEYKTSLRQSLIENFTTKLLCEYVDKPAVNRINNVVIRKITKNTIEVPAGHCVLTYGELIEGLYSPQVGDTLKIIFQTNANTNVQFVNGVSGTPRIARNSKYQNEAKIEGNNGKRFINHQLPRTMVGYDKTKKWFYLIVVEGAVSSAAQYGASLRDLEKIAKYLKLYDAINLDGGGSSIFVFNGMNKLRKSNPYSSRKVSVFLGVSTSGFQ